MHVWFRDNETGGREDRKECACSGIRASTGEPPQMGDTLDILSAFTTHSSNCLFTSRYVLRCVCLCVSLSPCLSVFSVCPVLYGSAWPWQQCVCLHMCLCVHVCVCPGPRRTICVSIRLSQSQRHSRESLCLPSYPFLLNEDDQKLLTHETGLQQIKLISFPVTTVYKTVKEAEGIVAGEVIERKEEAKE